MRSLYPVVYSVRAESQRHSDVAGIQKLMGQDLIIGQLADFHKDEASEAD